MWPTTSPTARHVLIGDGAEFEGRALEAADIPALAISKTTGLQAALDAKASQAALDAVEDAAVEPIPRLIPGPMGSS